MWTLRASLVVLVSLAGFVPCPFSSDALAAASAAPQDVLHQVLPGDDLRLIAGYYFGDTRQWEVIWKANRDQVSNPNRVRRGLLLRIPDVTPPAEPYADFAARARRAQPSVASSVKSEAATGPAAETPPQGPKPPAAGAPGPALPPGGVSQSPPTKRP